MLEFKVEEGKALRINGEIYLVLRIDEGTHGRIYHMVNVKEKVTMTERKLEELLAND